MTTQEFIESYDPCEEGRKFLGGQSLKWAWEHAPPRFLIWAACREGVLSESEQRLFAAWCARQVWGLLTDQRSRDAILAAEAFARYEISAEKLAAAWEAAREAAWEAAWEAAGEAAGVAQAAYLRENCHPNFDLKGTPK